MSTTIHIALECDDCNETIVTATHPLPDAQIRRAESDHFQTCKARQIPTLDEIAQVRSIAATSYSLYKLLTWIAGHDITRKRDEIDGRTTVNDVICDIMKGIKK